MRRRARHLADSLFRHTSETLCYSLVSGPTRESEVCRVVTVRVSGAIYRIVPMAHILSPVCYKHVRHDNRSVFSAVPGCVHAPYMRAHRMCTCTCAYVHINVHPVIRVHMYVWSVHVHISVATPEGTHSQLQCPGGGAALGWRKACATAAGRVESPGLTPTSQYPDSSGL